MLSGPGDLRPEVDLSAARNWDRVGGSKISDIFSRILGMLSKWLDQASGIGVLSKGEGRCVNKQLA